MTGNQGPKHKRDLTRRKVVVTGAGAVAAVGVAGGVAAGAFAGGTGKKNPTPTASSTSTGSEVCYALTSETTEGPYYIDADKIRQDITEDKEGIPLTLSLRVIDNETCKPIVNAAVDVWHCDALGLYSGYESFSEDSGSTPTDAPSGTPTGEPPTDAPSGGTGGGGGGHEEPTDDKRYLRGTWKTDRQGRVTFTTIFPGWYQGRCVHIHTKVHVDGTWTDAGYEGGTTCHTGQFYFDEESVLASAEVEPYSTSTTVRTTLTEDMIYDQTGTAGGLLTLKYNKKNIARGVLASITMGVDPEATHTGTEDAAQPGASEPATTTDTASPSASAS